MRIAFLCASADAGRDGVGDYSRILGEELGHRGLDTALLALNDHVHKGGPESKKLRLSRTMPWHLRLREGREFLAEFRPDFLSLQFVGYGFDPRGLPLGLATKLRNIAGGVPWHAMFHELWIEPKGVWISQVLSRLQKAFFNDLCRSLQPKLIHTSNENYRQRLAIAGISASVLPLFSNIGRVAPDKSLRQRLVGEFDPGLDSNEVWIFIFFGSIHPGWAEDGFLRRISEVAQRAEKKAALFLSIGKNPGKGSDVWTTLESLKTESLWFRKTGELSAPDVSCHLQAADFGIATTPLGLLGKSGSAAAMASHGLPTVVPRVDVLMDRKALEKNGLVPVDDFFEEGLLNPPKPLVCHSASETADLFLQQVQTFFKTT
jgi:hypothetical protein